MPKPLASKIFFCGYRVFPAVGINLGVLGVKNAWAGKNSGILRFWGVQKIFFGSKINFQVCDPGDSCDDAIALQRAKTTLGVVFVACQYDPISWRSSSGDTREFKQSCFWLMSVARETILEFER